MVDRMPSPQNHDGQGGYTIADNLPPCPRAQPGITIPRALRTSSLRA